MQTAKARKLVLNKETIRELTSRELGQVAGGFTQAQSCVGGCTGRSACGGCHPTCPCAGSSPCSGG